MRKGPQLNRQRHQEREAAWETICSPYRKKIPWHKGRWTGDASGGDAGDGGRMLVSYWEGGRIGLESVENTRFVKFLREGTGCLMCVAVSLCAS